MNRIESISHQLRLNIEESLPFFVLATVTKNPKWKKENESSEMNGFNWMPVKSVECFNTSEW